MRKILDLFLTFLKIGAFTFGGGYAMIAILENEVISKKRWLNRDEFLDMVAVAESTPGPAAINSATYIGYKTSGFFGALAATIAVSIPSFVIIYIISLFFDRFLALSYVGYAFKGIQVCVIYLIFSAGIKMFKNLDKNMLNQIIVIIVAAFMIVFSLFSVKFSSIFYILICGMLGIMCYFLTNCMKERKNNK